MLKIICLFIIISSLLYCSDNVLINKNIIQFPIKCNNKLNVNCKEEKEKSPEETQLIKEMMKEIGMDNIPAANIKLFHGKGCEHCNNS